MKEATPDGSGVPGCFHFKCIELLEEGGVVVLSLSGEEGIAEREAVAIFEESMDRQELVEELRSDLEGTINHHVCSLSE